MTDAAAAPAWEDPRRVLARHGLKPKRRLSQNFLVSRSAVERIAAAVAPDPGGFVVELGPGLGTLTGALLRAGARVLAVERDPDMLGVLEAELGDQPGLELRRGDAAELDIDEIARSRGGLVAVVGNLPYAITGAILRNLVRYRGSVSRAVLMVQREVRDRLLALPAEGAYGALTVFTSAAFRVESVFLVTAGSFHPKPKVDSAVVLFSPLDPPRAEETEAFRSVVRASFETRRKTLRNALRRLDPAHADAALEATGIDGRRRGETLSVEEFAALARAWGQSASG